MDRDCLMWAADSRVESQTQHRPQPRAPRGKRALPVILAPWMPRGTFGGHSPGQDPEQRAAWRRSLGELRQGWLDL